jgi:hypothetical protein
LLRHPERLTAAACGNTYCETGISSGVRLPFLHRRRSAVSSTFNRETKGIRDRWIRGRCSLWLYCRSRNILDQVQSYSHQFFPMSTFGSPSAGGVPAKSIDPNDCNVPNAGSDGISSVHFSPTANILVSSNWDSTVSCWEVQEQGGRIQANPKAQSKKF